MKTTRLFALLLAVCLLLASCGSSGGGESSSGTDMPSVDTSSSSDTSSSESEPEQIGFVKPDKNIVEDEEHLYYFNQADNRNLYRRNKSTGKEEVLYATSRGFIHHLALFEGRLYFINNSEREAVDSWLMSVDKNGGEARKELYNVEKFLISKDTIFYGRL